MAVAITAVSVTYMRLHYGLFSLLPLEVAIIIILIIPLIISVICVSPCHRASLINSYMRSLACAIILARASVDGMTESLYQNVKKKTVPPTRSQTGVRTLYILPRPLIPFDPHHTASS